MVWPRNAYSSILVWQILINHWLWLYISHYQHKNGYSDCTCPEPLFTCSFLAEGIVFILSTLCGYHHIIKRPRSKAAEGAFTEWFGNGKSLNNLPIMRERYQITVYISRSRQPRNTEVVTPTWVIYCYSSHTGRNCATKRKKQEKH